MPAPIVPAEGTLYKAFSVGGHDFELRYGYYEERERAYCPPVILYPDLSNAPLYCMEGYPLVTQIQDACRYYRTTGGEDEKWCGDCVYFSGEHREIGVCRCEHLKIIPKQEE